MKCFLSVLIMLRYQYPVVRSTPVGWQESARLTMAILLFNKGQSYFNLPGLQPGLRKVNMVITARNMQSLHNRYSWEGSSWKLFNRCITEMIPLRSNRNQLSLCESPALQQAHIIMKSNPQKQFRGREVNEQAGDINDGGQGRACHHGRV